MKFKKDLKSCQYWFLFIFILEILQAQIYFILYKMKKNEILTTIYSFTIVKTIVFYISKIIFLYITFISLIK